MKVFLLCAVVALALTGCTRDYENNLPAPPVTNEDQFDAAMQKGGYFPTSQDAEIGKQFCKAWSAGNSMSETASVLAESDFDASRGGAIMAASVLSFCPEHKDALVAWVESTT